MLMSNNYILNTTQNIGIDRLGSAIVFGKLLKDSVEDDKPLEYVVDTMLMITDLETISQIVRDYNQYITPHIH